MHPELVVITRKVTGATANYISNATEALKAAGLRFDELDQEEASAQQLAPYKLAILPLNTYPSAFEAALEQYVAGGGKLIVCYTASEAIAQLLGISQLEYRQPEYSHQFYTMTLEVGKLPGAPASVQFDSWNVFIPQLAAGASVVAWWSDREGKRSQLPALVASPNGFYLGHVFTGSDATAQRRLLLALVARFAPDAWREALEGRLHQHLHLGEFDSLAALRQHLEAQPTTQRRQRALEYAQLAEEKLAKAERHLKRGLYAETSLALDEAAAAAEEAFLRAYPPKNPELRGVWLVPGPDTNWDQVMKNLAEHGFNAVFPRMSRGGNCIYESRILPEDAWAKAKGDQLKACIAAAHKYGLKVYAWRVDFHLGSAPKWYYNQLASQDRLVRDAQGRQSYTWACPSNERNRRVEIQAMLEMVRNYDVDGIHFDYIRYPNSSYCYCHTCRRNFEHATGIKVAHWPQDVISGPYQHAYEQWEQDNISSLVRTIYLKAKALKSWIQVSAAVFPRAEFARYTIKQDWPKWAREGYIDFVCPMDYTPSADRLAYFARRDVELAEGHVPVMIGIGSYLHSGPAQTAWQIELARRAGASGFVCFSYSGWLPDKGLKALQLGVTSATAQVPIAGVKVNWKLPPGLDEGVPYYYESGSKLSLAGEIASFSGTAGERVSKAAPLSLKLEVLGSNSHSQKAENFTITGQAFQCEFSLPAGRVQPVLEGEVVTESGKSLAFERRGPILEGLTGQALSDFLARRHPPQLPADKLKVGVFEPGIGSAGILATVQQLPEGAGFYLYKLDSEWLAAADLVIVPQVMNPNLLGPRTLHRLREWVRAGGKLILTHDAVGFRVHLVPFPEIGRGAERATREQVVRGAPEVLGGHLSLERGKRYSPSYSDFIALKAANKRVQVVVKGVSGRPAVLAAPFGKGKVVLSGLIFGWSNSEEVPLSGWERQLFIDLLQWLQS